MRILGSILIAALVLTSLDVSTATHSHAGIRDDKHKKFCQEQANKPDNNQVSEQCKAYLAALDAAQKDKASATLWTATMITCAVSCVTAAVAWAATGTQAYPWLCGVHLASAVACGGLSIGATVSDIVATGDMTSAITGLISAGAGAYTGAIAAANGFELLAGGGESGSMPQPGSDTPPSETPSEGGDQAEGEEDACPSSPASLGLACLPTATALMNMLTKETAAEDNEEAAQQALYNAYKLSGEEPPISAPRPNIPNRPGVRGGGGGVEGGGDGSGGGGGGGGSDDSTDPDLADSRGPDSSDPCNDVDSPNGIVRCSLATGEFRPSLNSPDLNNKIQEGLGIGLPELIAAGKENPKAAFASGINGATNSNVGESLANDIYDDMINTAKNFTGEESFNGYTGGGGGSSARGGNKPDFAGMMSGLMGQLNPNKKKGKKTANKNLDFRKPASPQQYKRGVYQDSTINLFRQVSRRYNIVNSAKRLTPMKWSSPFNRYQNR